MVLIRDLELGFNDAKNYRASDSKELFNKIFVKTPSLDSLLKENVYFLIGEKGTGKTAYAVYLSNNNYKQTRANLTYIGETEYKKFISMKSKKDLSLSDYNDIWTVILYLLMAKNIIDKVSHWDFLKNFPYMTALEAAIDEFYSSAFSPEVVQAMEFVDNAEESAELISKHFKAVSKDKHEYKATSSRYQATLLYLKNKLEQALSSLRLEESHLIFIDGIDLRPDNIPYDDYLECIKGLANATIRINSFFSTLRKSTGRMRVVLIARPDIITSIGLHNTGSVLRDNSVLLDWRTTYARYRQSDIFQLANRLLSAKENKVRDDAWDTYFPYELKNLSYKLSDEDEYHSLENQASQNPDGAFIGFLRLSFSRPRDLVSFCKILQSSMANPDAEVFSKDDYRSAHFRHEFSEYLLTEVRDHMLYKHSEKDYTLFRGFFEYLNGETRFNYKDFCVAYSEFYEKEVTSRYRDSIPDFFQTPHAFIQQVYEMNVIAYIQETYNERPIYRWCYRERSVTNPQPVIKYDTDNITYHVHAGLSRSLNLGVRFR